MIALILNTCIIEHKILRLKQNVITNYDDE